MSHNVSFPFSPQLKESIQKAIHASSQLGSEESTKVKEYIISLHIENETFVLFKEYHCHTDVVVGELPVPVFFFCRDTEDPQQWGVVTYVSDTCPPKKKMICATCCQYLKKECGLTVVNEKRVFAEEDVHASLREVNEDARERAAARAERYAAALKQAEEDLAPRPMIGMGTSMNVTMKFSEDVLSELKALNETENPAGATLTLRINDQEAIVVDKTLGLIDGVNLPCYYLAYAPVHTSQGTGRDTTGCPAEEEHTDSDKNSGTETRGEPVTAYRQVCFYVLSSMAKPKERMRYASAKEQLLKELLARGCTFDKCKECASAEEVMELLYEGRAVENQWDFGKK